MYAHANLPRNRQAILRDNMKDNAVRRISMLQQGWTRQTYNVLGKSCYCYYDAMRRDQCKGFMFSP